MNSYLTRTREGNAKEEGTEKTHTNTPGPERANPEKAREKKSGGRRTRTKTRGGGEGRKRLNQPNKAKPEPTWARAGPKPNLGKETTHEIGDPWGLVDEKQPKKRARDSVPLCTEFQLVRSKPPVVRSANGINGLQVQ